MTGRRKLFSLLLVTVLVVAPGAQSPVQAQDDPVLAYIAGLTTQEKVGQLFLVTFHGDSAGKSTDIAELIQRYRIGGVVLSAANGNIDNDGDAAAQLRVLVRELQRLALETRPPRAPLPNLPEGADYSLGRVTPTATPLYEPGVHAIPLLIAVEQDGDGYPHTNVRSGVTELPSAMAVGATWDTANAYTVGSIVGSELASLGVNLLLGPSLDVLQGPVPALPGDIGVRSFGGDPYWVGEMGRAYVRGVHEGSAGKVLAVVKHFPGLGSSDRKATEEVATVQKSLQQLRQMELAPFFAITATGTDTLGIADGLMTSPLIRYRGFQGNIRQLTRPIGLDADGLSVLMALPEFQEWRQDGVLVSGPLGLPAVRRFYQDQGRSFPDATVAQEALMAGNDLIYTADFSLDGNWEEQTANVRQTIEHFARMYDSNPTFRARADDALVRVLRLKFRLYGDFTTDNVTTLPSRPGLRTEEVNAIADQAATLIYPEAEELAARLPKPPAAGEEVLIFTDVRPVHECDGCAPFDSVPEDALAGTLARLYGPEGNGRLTDTRVVSSSFGALKRFLAAEEAGGSLSPEQEALGAELQKADWIIFLMQDVDVSEYPDSDALRQFLKQRSDWMRNKRLVVFALNGPYFLDTTEVSKLTVFYSLYSKAGPFLETAARVLMGDLSPTGAPPVDVPAVGYELITQLEPDPAGVLVLEILGEPRDPQGEDMAIGQGSVITVRTGVIRDRNGHTVPDGTPVEFRLYYPSESLELPRQRATTTGGVAQTSIRLERSGALEVSATTASGSPSVTLVITVRGAEAATFATIVPPTPTPVPTPTPRPVASMAPTEGTGSEEGAEPGPAVPLQRNMRLGAGLLTWSLAGIVLANVALHLALRRRTRSPETRLRMTLWSLILGLGAYCAWVLGWFEVPAFMAGAAGWAALAVSLLGALLAGVSLIMARPPGASSST